MKKKSPGKGKKDSLKLFTKSHKIDAPREPELVRNSGTEFTQNKLAKPFWEGDRTNQLPVSAHWGRNPILFLTLDKQKTPTNKKADLWSGGKYLLSSSTNYSGSSPPPHGYRHSHSKLCTLFLLGYWRNAAINPGTHPLAAAFKKILCSVPGLIRHWHMTSKTQLEAVSSKKVSSFFLSLYQFYSSAKLVLNKSKKFRGV